MHGMEMIKFWIPMMMKEWNEDDRAFEPHDDDDDGWSMGMVTMSEDGHDVDDTDDDVEMTT